MAGILRTLPQYITEASATAKCEIGAMYYDSDGLLGGLAGSWYKYGKCDATLATTGVLCYLKTPATASAHSIYAVHDHATAGIWAKTRNGGWPCYAGTAALPYGWWWCGGILNTSVIASILTDTNMADGSVGIADSATDGAIKPYTLGTNDFYAVVVGHAADSGSALSSAVIPSLLIG